MFDLATIRAMNNRATNEAMRESRKPYVPTLDELQDAPPFPFPVLGYKVPKGWKQVFNPDETPVEWFVDHSGWGTAGELGLTADQFKAAILAYARQNPTHGYGIGEVGPFQCYVLAFVPNGCSHE